MQNTTTSEVSGWLAIDKPAGMSSAHVVARIKRALRYKGKIGHAGTLDPMATGMLVIALGEATKLIEYAMRGVKTYAFEITFGESRDTDDATGTVVAMSDGRPTMNEIQAALPAFKGTISQTPPAYSAIKVDGKRAYAMARAGEVVALKPRDVEIYELLVVSGGFLEAHQNLPLSTITLTTNCSKGTYVRSLARDIASKVNCLGYVSKLRRLASGGFSEGMMITLEQFEELAYKAPPLQWLQRVHAVDFVLDDILALGLPPEHLKRVAHGNDVPVTPSIAKGLVRVKDGNRLIALCECISGRLRPVRVFNLGAAC